VRDDGEEHVVVHVGGTDRFCERQVAQIAGNRFRSVWLSGGDTEIRAIVAVEIGDIV
jgi:hypothetical protein